MNVFRPSRIIKGIRVRSPFYATRIRNEVTGKLEYVALKTTDKEVAEKRARDKKVMLQKEQERMIAPKAQREAAATPLGKLADSYEKYLGTDCQPKHVHDTVTRLRRLFTELHWQHLADVQAGKFSDWLAGLDRSAKTKLEFQRSLKAFLNWLVETERLEKNPVARLRPVDTRGKKERESRAFTEDELRRLFAVAGKRLPAYLTLLYTAQRKSEVRALVWGDLHLEETKPHALFRESTTKDKDKRAVPLRPELAAMLRAMRPPDATATDKVFWFCWPTYDIMRGDLKRAGIEHKDALGRVAHFHSFRKTWQTFGSRHGVNQRAAQEILGHSDPSLTANTYTDIPALGLHEEMGKMPWFAGRTEEPAKNADARHNAHISGTACHVLTFDGKTENAEPLKKAAGAEELSRVPTPPDTSCHEGQIGCPGWDRTSDQVINSHLLCH